MFRAYVAAFWRSRLVCASHLIVSFRYKQTNFQISHLSATRIQNAGAEITSLIYCTERLNYARSSCASAGILVLCDNESVKA